MVETHYTEATLHMEPGDIFFTCSDGITAPGADRALGEEWVARRLADLAHLPAGELVDRLILEASSFYGRLRDDMSALAVKRLPTATADAP
jgi:serine phosphatase RsbU (regulator of sigma subunit)